MWKRAIPLGGAVFAMAVSCAAASAQAPGANDPEEDSPSGAVYEIPLDSARGDAAPRPLDAGSPIRSENGFGSSSAVPGARVSGDGGGARGRLSAEPVPAGAGDVAEDRPLVSLTGGVPEESPSHGRSYLLLALGVIVAVALGVAARRAVRGP